jgi:hypothetical protein
MKWWIAALLALNAGLFGYYELSRPAGGPQPGHAPLQADKLKMLSREEVDAMPRVAPPAPAPEPTPAPAIEPLACYDWGSFTGKRLPRARAAIARLALDTRVQPVAAPDALRYWVYIPPLRSSQAAQARTEQLRTAGVQESFVVQDAQWRNAISLGLFKDEALAIKLVDELHAKGISDAVKAVRNPEGKQFMLQLRRVPEAAAQEVRSMQPDFPYSELKQVACE